jgi:acyl-CoA thioesterase FadM
VAFQPAIFPRGDDTLLATGEIVWVLTDQATRRPIPIPADMRDALGRFEGMDFSAVP